MSSDSELFFIVLTIMVVVTCAAWTWHAGVLLPWVAAVPALYSVFHALKALDKH